MDSAEDRVRITHDESPEEFSAKVWRLHFAALEATGSTASDYSRFNAAIRRPEYRDMTYAQALAEIAYGRTSQW